METRPLASAALAGVGDRIERRLGKRCGGGPSASIPTLHLAQHDQTRAQCLAVYGEAVRAQVPADTFQAMIPSGFSARRARTVGRSGAEG